MHDYAPPRRRAIRHQSHEDAPSKIRRLVVREEGRRRYEERPFDPEAPRESYARSHHFAVNRTEEKRRHVPRTDYHVWESTANGKPIRMVSKKGLGLQAAKDLARIGATQGKHDRLVTTNPKSVLRFRILRHYERGTGRAKPIR